MTQFKDTAMGYPTSLVPTGTWPLDSRSYFEDKLSADAAAAKAEEASLTGTSMYYIGQPITVYDKTDGSVKLYYIGKDKALHQIEDAEKAKQVAEYLSNAISSKIFVRNFDEDGNEVSAYTDLSVIKIDKAQYELSAVNNMLLSNVLYVLSASYIDAYGQQLKNLAAPTELSDATPKKYVDDKVTNACEDLHTVINDNLETISTTVDQKIIVDGLSTDQLSLQHIDIHDYASMLLDDLVLSNQLYIVSSDFIDAYGQPIKNVANPTELSDATNKGYVDDKFAKIKTALANALTINIEVTSNISTAIDAIVSLRNVLSTLYSTL